MPIYDYIITGGAGFIGSHLAEFLSRSGKHSVLIVDDLRQSKNTKELSFKNIGPILNRKNIRFIRGDYRYFWEEFESEDDTISAGKAIYHLAANTDTTDLNIEEQINNNCDIGFLKWAKKQNVPFVFASSASLYGDGKEFNEESPLNPLNPYAFSKLLLEKEVQDINFKKPIGFRFFNVFGKNESAKGHSASMVYQIVQAAKENRTINLFKNGNQSRDFVPVELVVYVLAKAPESRADGIYNLGTGKNISFNQIINEVRAFYPNLQVNYIDNPYATAFQNYTCADVKKLTNAFGYELLNEAEYKIKSFIGKLCS